MHTALLTLLGLRHKPRLVRKVGRGAGVDYRGRGVLQSLICHDNQYAMISDVFLEADQLAHRAVWTQCLKAWDRANEKITGRHI